MSKCFHIQTPRGLEKNFLEIKGVGEIYFDTFQRFAIGICSSLALESLALHLARLLITAHKILST